jgi:hypothetical protein
LRILKRQLVRRLPAARRAGDLRQRLDQAGPVDGSGDAAPANAPRAINARRAIIAHPALCSDAEESR